MACDLLAFVSFGEELFSQSPFPPHKLQPVSSCYSSWQITGSCQIPRVDLLAVLENSSFNHTTVQFLKLPATVWILKILRDIHILDV